jgi:hypothetical protein
MQGLRRESDAEIVLALREGMRGLVQGAETRSRVEGTALRCASI